MNNNKELMTNIKDYKQNEIVNVFMTISFFNFLITMSKGHKYQSSWCKRGLFSISQNLERKYARLDNLIFPENGDILNEEKMGLGKSDGILDTISDLANYCNLALSFFTIKGNESEVIKKDIFEKFVDSQLNFVKDNFLVGFDDEIKKDYFGNLISQQRELLDGLEEVMEGKRTFHNYLIAVKTKLI